MDATQMINDSILESDEEENEEENENKRGRPLAKLCILKNQHIPEAELPLFLGENILGRDPNICTVPLPAASISKQHAAICISVYRRRGCHSEVDVEALVWDLGSMNGTRKGHLKLTPNVRYALSERDRLVVADIPCQYVSCALDIVSSQGDTISVSRNSGVKARLADASGEKGGDTSTGGKKCVNGGTKARVSLPDLEDTGKTPVRTGCLTFEQTPTQPQGTLVPESDSDSEGERGGANRRHKALVSDSDKSSPTCSTFLSPTNRIASVDESPITPSSSTKNRPSRHVSFSMETDIYVGRQQLKEKKALVIVDDSEEEEERAALGGRKSDGCNVSLTGEDESPVSTAEVAIPAFNMDSDTDVEGEEEGVACTGPVTLNTNQQADQPPNTAQFHMDSDTDVDEDDDAIDKISKSVPSSADNTKPPHVISVIQPEAITMDSDTDVDDDAVVSDAASEAKPVSFQSTETADSAPSMQIKDFYLDSDTDVDEEEEKGSRTINTCSKIDETPTRLDIKSTGAESATVTAHSLHLDSDTDDETVPAPVISEPSAASAVTASCIAEDTGSDVDALSDSDTDDDSCLVIPCVATTLKFVPCNAPEALQSDSDADTDVDEPSVPPAGDGVNPADLRVDSDTDVEDEKVDFRSAGDSQVPSLQRENTPGLLVPLLQNCSTPVQGGDVEDMDTQAFLSPSSCPFRSAVASAVRLESLSSCSGSQEDEDFVVAETQSFILQTRDCQDNTPEDHSKPPNRAFGPESSGDENGEQSGRQGSFQLGLSDSSHLQDQAQVLAMESTQAFVSVERGLNMEETRPYATISNAERTSVENESNLEATQDYGEEEEPARCSVTSEIEDQVDLALEATQAYISEPSDSEDKTDEDERKDTATQPLDFPVSSTLTMMETQPMSVFEEEECLDEENPFCSGLQVKARPQNETQEREEPEEDEPQARTLSKALSIAETQPMHASDNEESDEEDLIPGPRRGKAQPLQPVDEQTEPFTSSELSLAETQPAHICVDETQPVATSGNVESDVGDSIRHTNSELSAVEGQPMDTGKDGESDKEDSIPASRKRKAKPLQLEDESQTLTNSEHSAVEAQPVVTGDDGETDEEDSLPVIRKRKAKPLQLEESQMLTNSELSAVEGQPMDTREYGESDDEDSMPVIRKRKAKPLQLEEESQTLTNSELSAVEGQPTDTREDGGSDDEDSMPVIRKRKAKPLQLEEESQTLTNSELSAVEAQPVVTGDDGKNDDEDSVPGPRKRKAKPLQIQEEETQTLTNSEASTVETQPLETDSDLQPQRGKGGQSEVGTSGITIRGKTGTRGRLREEEGQAGSSELPKRQTRGKNKVLQTTRGSRGKSRPGEDEEVERAKQARGKNSISQPKDDEKEEETEVNKHAENINLIKEQEAGRLVEEGEKERREMDERERTQEERKQRREEQEKLERERKEKEEQEARNAERLRLEHERAEKETIERERKEQEEKERADRAQKEKEQLERERKEKEEKERLEHEKAEREESERLEREENERIEKERKEQEENARLETAKRELEERLERERKEQEHQERLESEAKERENKPKAPARGRRAARRTTAATCTTELEQDSTISINDDVPARRTRSRSNSSNSVNSEMSASSVSTQESSGRGRGRGAKKTSEPPRAAAARSSNRRRTVDAGPTPQGVLLRSNSNNSLNSEISSCSLNSQSRGRGGRQRGRGQRTETNSLINSQRDKNSAPKSPARGRKSRKADESCNAVPLEDEKEKADSQQASTTRGQRRANANGSEPAAADEDDSSYQEEGCATEELVPLKKNIRAKGQKAVKSKTVEASVAPAVNDGGEAKGKGRKRDLEPNTEEESSSSFKISKGTTEAAEAKTKDKVPVQAKRRGRASTSQAKKPSTEVEVKEESERMEEEIVERRGRGRPSAVQKKKIQEQEESGSSVDQDAHVELSEPQTPKSSGSRKRQATADFSPVAKTPRSSSASPAASGRLRTASQAYKVLFTGVVDEAGERVLARLGGCMAKGVADMKVLVTDKVRRTVKFLCAVAKGIPIVTTQWLEKSGKAGSFLPPNLFVVNDLEQEKKFNFCLQESLQIASSQPLLQGYEIHVTKSVKPEPVQMKDIITCSGATFLAKMPSSHKPRTVVISCEEDWFLCGPALTASLPVVTAEFILSGILQQKLDLQTNALSAPTSNLQPAGGRGRSRKKT